MTFGVYGHVRTSSLVSVEIGFCITGEFDAEVIELLQVVNRFLQTLSSQAVERPTIARGRISFGLRLGILG